MADDDFGFALPAFDAANALLQIKRSLRDLRLVERGARFELRGKPVVELQAEASVIQARLARRLMVTPDWDRQTVASAADQRKLLDEVRRRLARWETED